MPRNWLTAREVGALLGVGTPRVSRLKAEGQLVAVIDSEGRCRYDRAQVERFATERAALIQDEQETRERLRAEHTAAQKRAWRERAQEKEIEREREEKRDSVLERIASALEKLVKRPCN